MNRTGKIARLPRALREQINQRLQNGEPAEPILAWLNPLPEVQTILKDQFAGAPISKQNLSEWRKGGYIEWEFKSELSYDARETVADAEELEIGENGYLSDYLATILTARYASLIRHWDGEVTDDLCAKLKVLHRLIQDISSLRRWDHSRAKILKDTIPPDLVEETTSTVPVAASRQSAANSFPFPAPDPGPKIPDPIPLPPSSPVKPSQGTLTEPANPPISPKTPDSKPLAPKSPSPHRARRSQPVKPGQIALSAPLKIISHPIKQDVAVLTVPGAPEVPGGLLWGKGLPPADRPYQPTPCTGKCALANGLCTGCRRTEHEISRWPLLTVENRALIIDPIRQRLQTSAK